MPTSCCVEYCRNSNRKDGKYKFYRFPTARHKVEQRKRWIAAVNRKNPDGTPWEPKPHDMICSEHFVNNEKSNNMWTENYVPTIFPNKNGKKIIRKNKYRLVMKRTVPNKTEEPPIVENQQDQDPKILKSYKLVMQKIAANAATDTPTVENQNEIAKDKTTAMETDTNNSSETTKSPECDEIMKKVFGGSIISKTLFNKKCQMYTFGNDKAPEEKTFICNQFIYLGSNFCDVAIQTDMYPNKNKLKVNDPKVLKDKMSGTQDKVNVLVAGHLKPHLLNNLRTAPKKL